MSKSDFLIPGYQLPGTLVQNLADQNPWWEGRPLPSVPSYRRWPFNKLLARLQRPLAPILVVRGPRQVGKTTLQLQLLEQLLSEGVNPKRILRVQFDDLPTLRHADVQGEPILRIAEWFQTVVLGDTFNGAAQKNQPVFLFLDEVQNLSSWATQLKFLVDTHPGGLRVLVTGSSALRIKLGDDSLAGRLQGFEVGPLRLAEIAQLRGLGRLTPVQDENSWDQWTQPDFWHQVRSTGVQQALVRDAAYSAFSERGAYPFCHVHADLAWAEVSDQLKQTVINRVIQFDLRLGEKGRKRDRHLLEEVFRLACRYVGQSPNPATLAREAEFSLKIKTGPQRIRHYLDFLDAALLIRAIQPLEARIRKRQGYSKLCLCDHALRAAWLQEIIPLAPDALEQSPHLYDLAGHIAESCAGYYLASLSGLDLAHWPERTGEPEVDFIMIIGDKRIPVEIKYRRVVDPLRDTLGLRVFIEKAVNNAPFGLLITRDDATTVPDPRIICVPLRSLLLVR
ncbi:MAG: ATP-binding protein [Verrucomicrobia bacterium]|nr:ATP-binding protein [Verrucomicrobiota bacterium]